MAELLSAEWYKSQWPLIPAAEIDSSAVDLPHLDANECPTSTKVLMHKRRVPAAALVGAATVKACSDCYNAYSPARPKLCKYAFTNFLWLGRHLPMYRDARLGHQLLLALGRVVSTKVYLSSKGIDTLSSLKVV